MPGSALLAPRYSGRQAQHSGPRVRQLERAELARLTGDEPARQSELREAHRLFLEIGAPIRAEQVAKEIGS